MCLPESREKSWTQDVISLALNYDELQATAE